MHAIWLPSVGAALLALFPAVRGQAIQFNNPEGVDIWCGKAYRVTNSSFDPGGWFEEPPLSRKPLLRLRAGPRMSIYMESDASGSLLVDAAISYQVGQPISSGYVPSPGKSTTNLTVTVSLQNDILATASVAVGSTGNEIPLDLTELSPRLDAFNLTVKATLGAKDLYTTTAELLFLPEPTDYGSVSRIDHLHGGLHVRRGSTSSPWQPIFPYTYYVQWSLYWDFNVSTLDEFAAKGYNVIHIVPTGTLGDIPFPWSSFEPYLDRAAELGLWLHYDVLWTWTDLTNMIDQVTRLRTHPSILMWYQSDEADGKGNPPNGTRIAADTIRALDPYHPISLALNCANFHYTSYADGTDVVLSDVYPIGNNVTFSTVYDTPCNATYGCCGCDDCAGSFRDISDRLDEFRRRDDIVGWWKTQWFAPQAFGNETFWTRFPTAAEEVVMAVLAVNHGAKGLVMWDFPTSAELDAVTEKMAAVMTGEVIAGFLLGTEMVMGLEVRVGGVLSEEVDAAVWVDWEKREALLSVANLSYGDLKGTVEVELPEGVVLQAGGGQTLLWGEVDLEVNKGSVVAKGGLLGLQVSLVVLPLA